MNVDIDIELVSPVAVEAAADAADITTGAAEPTLEIAATVAAIGIEIESPAIDITTEGSAPVLLVATPGPPGAAGTSTAVTRTTAYALSGHRAVTTDDDGLAIYASSDDLDHLSRPVWLTTGAWDAGVVAALTAEGDVTEPTWTWTPGVPIWLGVDGVLTQTIPVAALFSRELAEVVDPQTIQFKPQLPIVKG